MGPAGRRRDLAFSPVSRLRGHYEARFRPDGPGSWILSGSAELEGALVGHSGTRVEVSTATIESEDTGIRDDVLRDVAAASGGRYYPLPASRRIPADILATLRDEMVREETRLWNAPAPVPVVHRAARHRVDVEEEGPPAMSPNTPSSAAPPSWRRCCSSPAPRGPSPASS
jgi:hypothetical protein